MKQSERKRLYLIYRIKNNRRYGQPQQFHISDSENVTRQMNFWLQNGWTIDVSRGLGAFIRFYPEHGLI